MRIPIVSAWLAARAMRPKVYRRWEQWEFEDALRRYGWRRRRGA